MKFEVMFRKYCPKENKDIWEREVVEADNEDEACEKILSKHIKGANKVDHILSCDVVDNKDYL